MVIHLTYDWPNYGHSPVGAIGPGKDDYWVIWFNHRLERRSAQRLK